MSLYSSLRTADLQQILKAYDLGALVQYELLKGGSANTNYAVETEQGKYVLTVCNNKSFEETQMLARLLVYLEDHHLETSRVMPVRSGAYVTSFKDKPVLLKSYIEGRVMSVFSEGILMKLGASLARLHQIPPPDYLPHSFPYGEHAFKDIDEHFADHPFTSWLSEKHALIKKSLLPEMPKCMIHGDLFYNNVILTKEQVPIIMDFEEVCYYYRGFDLGMAVVGCCCEKGKIMPSKMQALVRGYQEVNPLTKEEADHLGTFIVYGATATAFWRFRQFNILFPTEELKDSYKEMMAIADQAKAL
jgi:homoserine kinase type II